MKQFKTKIISNRNIAPDHYTLSFKMIGAKKVKPGQFFNIKIGDSYDPLLRRPFGAHKIQNDSIEILYKVVGKATKTLTTKKAGDILDVLGPLGNGFDIKSSCVVPFGEACALRHASCVLVAGGHGVAPLYALAKKLKTYNLKLITLIGAGTKSHIVCDKELRNLGAKVYVATEDGSRGYKGLVTDLLIKDLRRTRAKRSEASPKGTYAIRTTLYACGPKPMLKSIAKIAAKHKIPCQVSMEEYLACGTGVCMGCSIKTISGNKLVCKDGPVFEANEIAW